MAKGEERSSIAGHHVIGNVHNFATLRNGKESTKFRKGNHYKMQKRSNSERAKGTSIRRN